MIDLGSSLVTGRFFYGGTPDREVRIMQSPDCTKSIRRCTNHGKSRTEETGC